MGGRDQGGALTGSGANGSRGTSSEYRKRNPPSPAAHFHQSSNGNRFPIAPAWPVLSLLRDQCGNDSLLSPANPGVEHH
jgi:hypothetical protein